MKKKMRKLLSTVLAATMCLGLSQIAALGSEELRENEVIWDEEELEVLRDSQEINLASFSEDNGLGETDDASEIVPLAEGGTHVVNVTVCVFTQKVEIGFTTETITKFDSSFEVNGVVTVPCNGDCATGDGHAITGADVAKAWDAVAMTYGGLYDIRGWDDVYQENENRLTVNNKYAPDDTQTYTLEGNRVYLYAILNEGTFYTVTFVDGDETTERKVAENETAAEPEAPVKDGYDFDGWFETVTVTDEKTGEETTALAETAYDFEKTPVTKDLTLTAKWTPLHTVTFTDGEVSEIKTVRDGETVTPPELAEKAGYRFDGWYTTETVIDEETEEISVVETRFDATIPIAEGLNLIAKWVKTWTVTFDSNGGSAVEAQTVDEGQTAARPADPTRSGYTFNGWYATEAVTDEETGETAEVETRYDFETPVDGDLTLTARWTENESSSGGSETGSGTGDTTGGTTTGGNTGTGTDTGAGTGTGTGAGSTTTTTPTEEPAEPETPVEETQQPAEEPAAVPETPAEEPAAETPAAEPAEPVTAAAEPAEDLGEEPDVPLSELPQTPAVEPQEPVEDLSDGDTPLSELPEDLAQAPVEEPSADELADEADVDLTDGETPLADVPQTGDNMGLWMALVIGSLLGLVWLNTGKRKDEENA